MPLRRLGERESRWSLYFNPLRVAFRDGALEQVIGVEFDRSTQESSLAHVA